MRVRNNFVEVKSKNAFSIKIRIYDILIFVFLVWIFVISAFSYQTPSFVRIERPPDIAEEADEPPAVFPHLFHQEMFYCYVCHPTTFRYGRSVMTHNDFDRGKFCGACHNGKISMSIDDMDCEVCHH